MSKMSVLAMADTAIMEWLTLNMSGRFVVEHVSESGLEAAASAEDTALLVIQTDFEGLHNPLERIKQILSLPSQPTVLAVAEHADSATILAAMRAGVVDFLLKGQDDDRFDSLAGNLGVQKVQPVRSEDAHITAILSGQADPGLAFLGQHVVAAMMQQRRKDESVLLLDIAEPAGAANVFMNIKNDYSVLDAIEDGYRCDATLVNTAFGHHPDGAVVLSRPENNSLEMHVDADKLRNFLDVVSTLFSQIVICADASIGEASIHCIAEYARHGVILGDQSILSSRHNQFMVQRMRSAGLRIDHFGLVVDRYQKRIGLEPDKLAELLGLPLMTALAGDTAVRMKAMNAGQSLYEIGKNDDYLRDLDSLVGRLLGRSAAESSKRGGFLEKLLS